MRRLSMLAALCLVAVVVFAPAALAQEGQNVTVSMEDNYFEQPNITVEPGTTVTWVQTGQNPHTTTSYDGLWDSGMIEGGSGGTFSFTFEEPGTYAYYCIPHEDQGMTGTVTVTGGGGAAGDSASGGAQQGQLADTGGPPLIVLSGTLALALCGLAALVLLRRRRAS
jgi:MYXO-CTERM domain-containing protein